MALSPHLRRHRVQPSPVDHHRQVLSTHEALKTTFTDGGLEIFTYELSRMSADAINDVPLVGLLGGSASGTKKERVILFDDQGVVKKFSMSESPVKVKTDVFNSGG